MHARKTGALIRVSVMMAAACAPSLDARLLRRAGAVCRPRSAWRSRSRTICWTCSGDVSTLGKATGADSERAKPTHPAVIGIEASQERVRRSLQAQALESLARRCAPCGREPAVLRLELADRLGAAYSGPRQARQLYAHRAKRLRSLGNRGSRGTCRVGPW